MKLPDPQPIDPKKILPGPIRPLPLWGSLILFAIPTVLIWLVTRFWIPVLREQMFGPDILCWFVAGGSVFSLLFVTAFIAIYIERRELTLRGIAVRFRLRRISFSDVAWSLGALVICGLLTAGIHFMWQFASYSLGSLPEPSLSPSFIQMEPLTAATWWVLVAWLPLFFSTLPVKNCGGVVTSCLVRNNNTIDWHGLSRVWDSPSSICR